MKRSKLRRFGKSVIASACALALAGALVPATAMSAFAAGEEAETVTVQAKEYGATDETYVTAKTYGQSELVQMVETTPQCYAYTNQKREKLTAVTTSKYVRISSILKGVNCWIPGTIYCSAEEWVSKNNMDMTLTYDMVNTGGWYYPNYGWDAEGKEQYDNTNPVQVPPVIALTYVKKSIAKGATAADTIKDDIGKDTEAAEGMLQCVGTTKEAYEAKDIRLGSRFTTGAAAIKLQYMPGTLELVAAIEKDKAAKADVIAVQKVAEAAAKNPGDAAVAAAQRLVASFEAVQKAAQELAVAAKSAEAKAQGVLKGAEPAEGASESEKVQSAIVKRAANDAIAFAKEKNTEATKTATDATTAMALAKAAVSQVQAAAADAKARTVTSVTVNAKTVSASAVSKAITKAGGDVKYVKTITLGAKVKTIKAKAFAKCKKVTKLVVKTTKLKKAGVKNCLKGSKVKTVQVKVAKSKLKKTKKAYKKLFVKKIAGKKAAVK